jgi:hypothetical protein
MRTRWLIFLFLALSAGMLSAQEDIRITWNYNNLTFRQFISEAEQHTGVRFFFSDDWVEDLRPGEYPGKESIFELFSEMFKGRFLYFYRTGDGDIIITKDYEIGHIDIKAEEEKFFEIEEYSLEEERQKTIENLYIEIGNPADRNRPGSVDISGVIIESDTRESLIGATIFIEGLASGTVSNQLGFFNLNLPRGSYKMLVTYVGMKQKRIFINVYGPGTLNIEMTSALIPLKEAIVYAQRNAILQRQESGAVKIDIEAVKFQPTVMGEPDIVKSILLIPGVQSVGEGAIGFNVRGGSADQNLMLLYGAPVYYPSHFFGFFTSVNADIIKDFTIYKGGIPAKYGGRISSVIDITQKEGNRREFSGNAGISPVTTHLLLEGPLVKDKASFFLAGRTTYSNWVLKLIDDPALQNSQAAFYDLNASVSWDLNKNNKLDISSYISHDAFRLNSDTLYEYNNNIVSARLRHFFTQKHYAIFTLDNSFFSYRMSSDKLVTEAFSLYHQINTSELKADFSLFQGKHEIRYGMNLSLHSVLPGNKLPLNDSSLVLAEEIPVERALEGALYIDEKYSFSDAIFVNAGLRLSTFHSFGPGSVLIYDPAFSKQKESVIDTVTYGKGNVISKYAGPEFRFSVNFRTSENSSLKLNYNHMLQYLHLLSNTTSISPTDTWKLSDYYLKPQAGDQFAAGFYKQLVGGRIESSVEVYYKRVKNVVDYKGMADLVFNEHIEMDLAPVRGRAYGIELQFKKIAGRTRWDAGYTWSRALLQSTGVHSDESINGGRWFPANYDKPHNVVLTYTFIYSRRLSFSSNFIWSSGRPVTYPITSYYIGHKLVIQYSDRNQYRVPDYARLDVSCTINGNLRSHKIANPHLVLSVYNLLGRDNVYSVYFGSVDNVIHGYRLSVFAKAIPSVSFNFDF